VSAIVRDSLGVQPGEQVLVIADPTTEELGERLREEGEAAGAETVLALMAERSSNGEDPPPGVAAAMLEADAIIAPTSKSLSHSAARRKATEAGARVATLPGVTVDMLGRVMSVDMDELERLTHAIAERLTAASEARITCPNGSDLTMSLDGRDGLPDDGRLSSPRAFGNLPPGEGFIAPREDRGDGTLVIDGSIADVGLLDEPAALTIEGGRLVRADTEAGERLLAMLAEHGGENLAELGVGANDRAMLTGNVLEDEKLAGTVHIAFGASASFGGDVQVPVHLDCVITKPELTLDGEPLVSGGRLLL
jgi:leucyl aminopeptidase (aminopeptidase T)